MQTTRRKRICLCLTFIILPLVFSIFAVSCMVDYKNNLEVFKSNGVVSIVRGEFSSLKITSEKRALDALDQLKDIYGFKDVYSEFKPNKIMPTADGFIFWFDQMYDDVYVYPRGIKVSVDSSFEVNTVSGNYLKGVRPFNTVSILGEQAVQYILDEYGVSQAYECTLVLFTLDTDTPLFAYQILAGSDYYYVDAQACKTISVVSNMPTATTEPHDTIQTDYYDNPVPLTISKSTTNGMYTLMDGYRNIGIYNANNREDFVGMLYSSATDVFTDKFAVTAYDYFQDIYDFYTVEDNVGTVLNGIDNSVSDVFGEATERNERQVRVILHFGNNYPNAAYAGEYNTYYTTLIFGDYRYYILALDVCAHEYQHAITSYNAGLIYQNASGALDEAISDMFGALVEGYEMSDDEFWLMGENIPNMSPTRNAANPWRWHMDQVRFSSNPSESNDYGGVHSNCTVITHAFYNMYRFSVENNITTFNKQNLGKMLYSVVQLLSPNSGFDEFAQHMLNAPNMLNLNASQRGELKECIKYGFGYVGIFETRTDERKIEFRLTDDYVGTAPETIFKTHGESFVIPVDTDVAKPKFDFIGWSETEGVIDSTDCFIYLPGEEYQVPFYDMVLYPVSLAVMWNDLQPSVWQGDGSALSPYLIKNAQDLATLAYYTNMLAPPVDLQNKHFKMTADIDLLNEPWIPISVDENSVKNIYFDGGGYLVKNLNLTEKIKYQGLFGVFKGELSNLRVGGVANVDSGAVGGIAGLVCGNSYIYNCTNAVIIDNANQDGTAGGIAGRLMQEESLDCIIKNCLNVGQIRSTLAGGIFGEIIPSEYSKGSSSFLEKTNFIGNCINSGQITGMIAGGIAAKSVNTVFVNCINTASIEAKTDIGNKYLGGITGTVNDVYVLYQNLISAFLGCKNTGLIQTGQNIYAGGIIGYVYDNYSFWLSFEKNAYKAQSDLQSIANLSNIGKNKDESLSNGVKSLEGDTFSADFNFGRLSYFLNSNNFCAVNGISNLDFLTNWKVLEGNMPSLEATFDFWDSAAATSFDAGDGSLGSPYQISSAAQLALLLYNVNNNVGDYSEKHYVQTEHIDLGGKIWTGIGYVDGSNKITSFKGMYDGGGYIIKNMAGLSKTFDGKTSEAAMFSYLEGTVKNVTLDNCNIVGENGAAGIVYGLINAATVDSCIVDGSITSQSLAAGIALRVVALQQNKQISITNCAAIGSISARTAGGIVAQFSGFDKDDGSLYIRACANRAKISNYLNQETRDAGVIAGIIGDICGDITLYNCLSVGDILNYGFNDYTSGIAGLINGLDCNINMYTCFQAGRIDCYNSANASALLARALEPSTVSNIVMESIYYSSNHSPHLEKSSDTATIKKTRCIMVFNKIGEGAFEFDNEDYYLNGNYFEDKSDSLSLYWLLNYQSDLVVAKFFMDDGSIIKLQILSKGQTATLPATPSKKSDQYKYTFIGWGTDDFVILEDTYFTAQFTSEIAFYTVTYLNKNGSVIKTVDTYNYGDTLQSFIPEKKDSEFLGWYLDKELTIQADEAIIIQEDVSLYAKWKEESIGCSCGTVGGFNHYLGLGLGALILVLGLAMCLKRRKQIQN